MSEAYERFMVNCQHILTREQRMNKQCETLAEFGFHIRIVKLEVGSRRPNEVFIDIRCVGDWLKASEGFEVCSYMGVWIQMNQDVRDAFREYVGRNAEYMKNKCEQNNCAGRLTNVQLEHQAVCLQAMAALEALEPNATYSDLILE